MSMVKVLWSGVSIFMEISSGSISVIWHGVSCIIGHHILSFSECVVLYSLLSHRLVALMDKSVLFSISVIWHGWLLIIM